MGEKIMKRLVTYLYAYEKGRRGKNTGFIKADIYKEETHIAVFLQNVTQRKSAGKIYLLVKENGLVGILTGEICVEDGHGDAKIQIENIQINGSRFSIQDVVGIAIIIEGGEYLASCWEDAYEAEIETGEFGVWERIEAEEYLENTDKLLDENRIVAIPQNEELVDQGIELEIEKDKTENEISYEKIELSGIRSLPSPNWHFCNNSFLVHGFWNYGYLVLKKEIAENQEKLFLGVPGIFEKPEMVMAVVFGFTDFEATPSEIGKTDLGEILTVRVKEKNQEPKTGEFGCWFVELK